jgi:hypothetical protein
MTTTSDRLDYSPFHGDVVIAALVDGIPSARTHYHRRIFDLYDDTICPDGGPHYCGFAYGEPPAHVWTADAVVDERQWLAYGLIIDTHTGVEFDPKSGYRYGSDGT